MFMVAKDEVGERKRIEISIMQFVMLWIVDVVIAFLAEGGMMTWVSFWVEMLILEAWVKEGRRIARSVEERRVAL